MTKIGALLMGGACLGLLMLQASSDSDGRIIADTIKARVAKLQQFGGARSPIRFAQAENQTNDSAKSAATDDKPAAVTASAGVTSYYGGGQTDTGTAKWAAEATVFEAVAAAEAAPSAPTQDVEAAQPTPAAATPAVASAAGVTSYYGDSAPAEGQAFSAPATVFETAAGAPAASTAAPADAPVAAAPEAAAKTEAALGVTSYYGDTAPAEGQPFSAPATIFIAVDDAKPADEAPAAATAKAVEAPKVNYVESNPAPAVPGVTSYYGGSTQRAEDQDYAAPATMVMSKPGAAPVASKQAVESCRDQLAATVQAGRILFANSSFEIRAESFRTLDKLAGIAKACGGVNIEIGGHTDNTGSTAGNTQLSLLRAQAVLTYLVKEGVEKSKIKAVGFGQSSPLATNTTPEGRQKNRRIEFVVIGG